MIRQEHGAQGVKKHSGRGNHRHDAYDLRNGEMLGKEGENEVDRQLRAEVRQNKRAEKSVGNAVHLVQRGK